MIMPISLQIQNLQAQLNDAEVIEANILQSLERVQHQVGDAAEQLSKLNNQMARLELSEETDETLALKIDQLRTELSAADKTYRALLNKEVKLQQAELEAIQKLNDARNELKLAQLKSS